MTRDNLSFMVFGLILAFGANPLTQLLTHEFDQVGSSS